MYTSFKSLQRQVKRDLRKKEEAERLWQKELAERKKQAEITRRDDAWARMLIKHPDAGWVYVIVNPTTPLVKIGMTKKPKPDDRAKELDNTSVGGKHEVRYAALVKNAFEVESLAHKKLQDYRVEMRREWFSCTIRNAADVVFQIARENDLFIKNAFRNLDQTASDARQAELEAKRIKSEKSRELYEKIMLRRKKQDLESEMKVEMRKQLSLKEKELHQNWEGKSWISKFWTKFWNE